MIICGSDMFEFSVSKNKEKEITMIKGEFRHIFSGGALYIMFENHMRS